VGKLVRRNALRNLILVMAIPGLLLPTGGCAWMLQTLLDAAVGECRIRDGRDQDADGLTLRDTVARSEERTIRDWDNERNAERWAAYNDRVEAAENPPPFSTAWQDFLNRERKRTR
jgi:hypothetical protein